MSEVAGRTILAVQQRTTVGLRAGSLRLTWPIAAIGAVLYGSLLPLNIDWTTYQASNGFGLGLIGIQGGTGEDILTNLLVYIPVGVALMLCGSRRGGIRWARIPLVVLVGTAVSIAAESLQTGIAVRVASWMDVAVNAFGTGIGAVVGIGLSGVASATGNGLRRTLSERPYAVLASLLTLGLFVYGLMPFDFTTDTSSLHASFGRARWDLGHARPISPGDPPFAQGVAQLTWSAWFAVLGGMLALAALESRRPHTEATGLAAQHGIVIASLIEFMQVFTVSHAFDLASIVLRVLAVMFGAWCAVYVAKRRGCPGWGELPGLTIPILVLIGAVVFQACARFLSVLDPGLLSLQAVDLANVGWVPFEALWHRPLTSAFSEAVSILVTYGTLAVTLAIILHRMRFPAVWIFSGAVVTLVAIAGEALQLCTLSQTPDLTGPVLALAAVVAVSHLHRMILPSFAPRHRGDALVQVSERALNTP